MVLRFGFFFGMVVACCHAQAQRDSILLQPVTVYGLPDDKYLVGSSIVTLDSSLHQTQASRNLGEILAFQLPVYFRTYGNGMSSGIAMRGTSPQQVAVRWNGININSFSLGQADFSILPAVVFDAVRVHSGGGSTRFGSGAIGGSVLLSSVSRQPVVLNVSQEVGSYGRYFSSVRGAYESGRFTASSSFYHLRATNDFPIPGTGERQSHAAYRQQGFLQSMQFDFSASRKIKLDYWFHDADRDIQPTAGNRSASDTQGDQNHRLSVGYEQHGKAGLIKLGGGIVDDNIIYNGIPSRVIRWIGSAGYQYSFVHQLHVAMDVEWNHIKGKIRDYGVSEPEEDRVDLSGSLQKRFDKISLAVNLRQPFISRVAAPFLPYVGVALDLVKTDRSRLTLNSNVSKNFRAPTLNERYWQDAGRKDLRPETSHAAEMGIVWQANMVTLSATGFAQRIDEWIQWVPEAIGIYRPQNVKRVDIDGFETAVALSKTAGAFSVRGRVSYHYTRSITKSTRTGSLADIGKQLIYTPVHTGSTTLFVTRGTWSTSLFLQYSGRRFTESSNASLYSLDPFALVDISAGKSLTMGRHHLALEMLIKNVFDTTYQLYSGRAMPGRNFSIKLLYQLNRKQP